VYGDIKENAHKFKKIKIIVELKDRSDNTLYFPLNLIKVKIILVKKENENQSNKSIKEDKGNEVVQKDNPKEIKFLNFEKLMKKKEDFLLNDENKKINKEDEIKSNKEENKKINKEDKNIEPKLNKEDEIKSNKEEEKKLNEEDKNIEEIENLEENIEKSNSDKDLKKRRPPPKVPVNEIKEILIESEISKNKDNNFEIQFLPREDDCQYIVSIYILNEIIHDPITINCEKTKQFVFVEEMDKNGILYNLGLFYL
jgi:hypothetical protein